jgi:hypothetical protein
MMMMMTMGIPIQILDHGEGDCNRQVLGILLNTNFWTLKVCFSSMIILLLYPLVKSSFSPIYKKRDRFDYKSNKDYNRGIDVGDRLESRKYGYLALVGILIILMFIIYGFYGFSNFLTGIEDKEVTALLMIIIFVSIILIMLQRAGIIFADKENY